VNHQLCGDDHRTVLRASSLLLRHAEFFVGSIADNLLLNHPHISSKMLLEKLNQFGLFDKIMQQPQGLKTIVYDWQAQFSELELTKLMLVRALLRPPQWLVIDRMFDAIEATAIDDLITPLLTLHGTILLIVTQKPALSHVSNRLVLP